MKITRKIKYKIGEEVVLRIDPLTRRLVTGYAVREKHLSYIIYGPDGETWHQEFEIEKSLTPKVKKAGFVK